MRPNKKVLILYASYGEGHRQVTSALEQGLSAQGMDVVCIDLYAKAHPYINAITRKFYLKSFSSWWSRLYGWSYYWTRNLSGGKSRSVFSFGIHTLKKLLQAEKPDAVINTFPISAMPELRRTGGVDIPTFTVLTDFCLHDLWIHPNIDKYFVATDELKSAIVRKGIRPDSIRVSGIPLRPSFDKEGNDAVALSRFNLDPNKKTVLIMAGAYGVLQNIDKIVPGLLKDNDVQIVLVCGKNEKLKQQLEHKLSDDPRVILLGYVEHISALMSVSTCIITKAGGITLSEALAKVLPMVLYRPVPGQEKENADFMAEKGAAIIAEDVEQLVESVGSIVKNSGRAKAMMSAIQSIRNENSTQSIVTEIVNDLQQLDSATPQKKAVVTAKSLVMAQTRSDMV